MFSIELGEGEEKGSFQGWENWDLGLFFARALSLPYPLVQAHGLKSELV